MNIDITGALFTLNLGTHTEFSIKRAPVKSMFVEGLPLEISSTL